MSAISIPTSETGAGAGAVQSMGKATAPCILMVDPGSLAEFPIPPTIPALLCRYNPKSLTISGGAQWSPVEGDKSSPQKLEFKGTNPRTITMELFIDLFFLPYGNVDWELRALQDWCKARYGIKRGFPFVHQSAPFLRLQWGESSYFKCVLESYTITHTLFSKSGAPMRATVSVTLKETHDDLPFTNPTSGGVGGETQYLVRSGDTLHSIAFQRYGQARYWRGLATFNGIDDPMRVAPGAVVDLPAADVISDQS